jgi:hypothetical protein
VEEEIVVFGLNGQCVERLRPWGRGPTSRHTSARKLVGVGDGHALVALTAESELHQLLGYRRRGADESRHEKQAQKANCLVVSPFGLSSLHRSSRLGFVPRRSEMD